MRTLHALAIVSSLACGRIGFDDHSGGSSTDGGNGSTDGARTPMAEPAPGTARFESVNTCPP